jgi:hypothetical protein
MKSKITRCAISNYGAYIQVYIEAPPEASGGRLYIRVSQLKIYINYWHNGLK